MRKVIVTTVHRGVFFGTAGDTTGEQIVLTNARMCLYWSGTKGILSLAETGPGVGCKIGAVAPRIELRSITAVIDVTAPAAAAWEAAP